MASETSAVKYEDILPAGANALIDRACTNAGYPATTLKKVILKINELVTAVGGGILPLA